MKVYVIEQKECSDYCGIGGTWFKTEVYEDNGKASERLTALAEEHPTDDTGMYFVMTEYETIK